MSLVSNLLGQYVWIHSQGDAGTVCAVFVREAGGLYVLVHRDNVSKDFRIYNAEAISTKKEE